MVEDTSGQHLSEPSGQPETESSSTPEPEPLNSIPEGRDLASGQVAQTPSEATFEQFTGNAAAGQTAPEPILVTGNDEGPSIEDDYRALVREIIERNRFYPARARRMREEGRMLVAFIVRFDGGMEEIRLVRGSGFRSLDHAAMTTIDGVGKFPEFPDVIGGTSWRFEIELSYRIQ